MCDGDLSIRAPSAWYTGLVTLLTCLCMLASSLLAEESAGDPQANDLWSLAALSNTTPPVAEYSRWCHNPIDRFVLGRLEAAHIQPNASAEQEGLIRRLSFDLLGIPPSPSEVEAFCKDKSEEAYERLVDRLLASPRFGERWGRHWLDIARFAESYGFEHDFDIESAYHYRDFVIQALNEDMRYDRFVRLQIAGDELEPDHVPAWMATGFLTAGVHNWAYTQIQVEVERYNELDDMVSTLGTAMLGMNIGCARCHDHKYDPISQKEYYRLLAVFERTVRSEVELDFDPEWYARVKSEFDGEHAPFVAALERFEKEQLPSRLESWIPTESDLPMPDWLVLSMAETSSSGGATFEPQKDSSVLLSGKNPAQDDFVLVAETQLRNIRWLRLEALSDSRLPSHGPGRRSNGNFVLTNLRLKAEALSGSATPVTARWKSAEESSHQDGLTGASAIDDDEKSGWAIHPKVGQSHWLLCELEEPLGFEGGTKLTFELEFRFGGSHVIGRPRLSISSGLSKPNFDGSESPSAALAVVEQAVRHSMTELSEKEKSTVLDWYRVLDPDWQRLNALVQKHLEEEPQRDVRKVLVASEGLEPHRIYKPRPAFYETTYFLEGGDTKRKRGEVEVGFPSALYFAETPVRTDSSSSSKASVSPRRSALAHWITDTSGGPGQLLARVIVNRLWHHHFGRGIVATPSDFGKQGDTPSHPKLLDWLAHELIRNGWRLKPIHRLIVTSATYRQNTDRDEKRSKADPENALLWRRSVRRLEGEAIRDAMLQVSGALDSRMYGPGTLDQTMKRRSIYFKVKRSLPIPLLTLFDSPDGLVTVDDRPRSTVAPQALALMNNEHVRGYARELARRILASSELSPEARIERAHWLALGRPPTELERDDAFLFLGSGNSEEALIDLCHALFCLNEFLYVQ